MVWGENAFENSAQFIYYFSLKAVNQISCNNFIKSFTFRQSINVQNKTDVLGVIVHTRSIHRGFLRLSVNIFVTVFVHAGWGTNKTEKDITLYHRYRQKVMSILKQTANNRRQKYNNTRQSAYSEGEFQ